MEKLLRLFGLMMVLALVFGCGNAAAVKDAYDKGLAAVNAEDPYQNFYMGEVFLIGRVVDTTDTTTTTTFNFNDLTDEEPKAGDDLLGCVKIETELFVGEEPEPVLTYDIDAVLETGATLVVEDIDNTSDTVEIVQEVNITTNIFNFSFDEAKHPNVNFEERGDKVKVKMDYYPEGYEKDKETKFTYFLEGDTKKKDKGVKVVGWEIKTNKGNDVRGEKW